MNTMIDLCVIPLGQGLSLSPYVAECQKILERRGLEHQMHAYGTNIAGDWDEVFAAVKECHEQLHSLGIVRITTTIKVGTRTDRQQSMSEKIQSVVDKTNG